MLTDIKKLGYGGAHLNTILPKIIQELQGFTISGPLAGVAANAPLAIPTGIDIQDTILKVLTLNGGTLADVTAQTTITDLRATATLTLAAVAAGDVLKINGLAYKFVAASTPNWNTVPGAVALGTNDTGTAANLVGVINNQSNGILATSAAAVVTLKVVNEGTTGNTDAIDVSGTHTHITTSGATFAGGSAANSVSISTATTGAQILMFWYKKSRIIGEI